MSEKQGIHHEIRITVLPSQSMLMQSKDDTAELAFLLSKELKTCGVSINLHHDKNCTDPKKKTKGDAVTSIAVACATPMATAVGQQMVGTIKNWMHSRPKRIIEFSIGETKIRTENLSMEETTMIFSAIKSNFMNA